MYCRECGSKLSDGAIRCEHCGTPVEGPAGAGYQNTYSYEEPAQQERSKEPNSSFYQDNRSNYGSQSSSSADSYQYSNGSTYYGDHYNQYQGSGPVYEKQSGARKGFAIASLVLGILGVVGTCCSFFTMGILNLLLGVIGLVLGILGLKSQGKGMSIAGIVLSVISIIIGILIVILMVYSVEMTNNMTPQEMQDLINQIYEMEESLEALQLVFLR